MKVHFTLADGTSKVVDIDVKTLSEEQLDVYASMGAEEAIDELKSRIGFNPYKPLEEMSDKDVERYAKWKKSQKKKKKKEDNSNE
jgi:hypothetical protein